MNFLQRLFGFGHHEHDCDEQCQDEELQRTRERMEDLERRARELEFEVGIHTQGRRHDDRRHHH